MVVVVVFWAHFRNANGNFRNRFRYLSSWNNYQSKNVNDGVLSYWFTQIYYLLSQISLIWFSTCNTDLQKKVSLTKLEFLWLIVSCCNLLFTLRYEGTKKHVSITRRTLTFILIWSARELLFITDESVNTNERSVCTGLAGCSVRQQMQWNQQFSFRVYETRSAI